MAAVKPGLCQLGDRLNRPIRPWPADNRIRAALGLGSDKKLTATKRLAGEPSAVRPQPAQLEKWRGHRASGENQRNTGHALVWWPDARPDASPLDNVLRACRHGVRQSLDMVSTRNTRPL